MKIKLGSITPQFKGQATFIERDDDAHTATLKAEGRDTGGRGNASAEIAAQAESLSPTSTGSSSRPTCTSPARSPSSVAASSATSRRS